VGPGASLDAVKKRITSFPTGNIALIPCSTAHSLVTTLNMDYIYLAQDKGQ
jgi:hypothetical protein